MPLLSRSAHPLGRLRHAQRSVRVRRAHPGVRPRAQAQKARVEDMVAEEATIDGLEHIECKIFK